MARWDLLIGEDEERYLTLSTKLAESLVQGGHLLGAEVTYKEALANCGRLPALRKRLEAGLDRLLQLRS